MSRSDEVVDVDVKVKAQTTQAVLFSDGDTECWIPRSQIIDGDEYENGEEVTITIPEWVAEEKGLI